MLDGIPSLGALSEWIRDARRAGCLFFNSSYVNAILRVETTIGSLYLVAGKHEENFPFWGVTFDNILLFEPATERYWQISGEKISELTMHFSDEEKALDFQFDGRVREMKRGDGRTKETDISLAFRAKTIPLGLRHHGPKRYIPSASRFIPGVRFNSQLIDDRANGNEIGQIQLDNVTANSRITTLQGFLEVGKFSILTPRFWRAPYDYLGTILADGRDVIAHVVWRARSFRPSSLAESLVNAVKSLLAGETTVMLSKERNPLSFGIKNPYRVGLNCEKLFSSHVTLGEITLERIMVRTSDKQGRTWYGLQEIFHHPDLI